jgi:hypothetical protein
LSLFFQIFHLCWFLSNDPLLMTRNGWWVLIMKKIWKKPQIVKR